jgi:hypothetical protein
MWCIGALTEQYRERMYELLALYARPVDGDRKARDFGDRRGLTAGGRVGDFGFSLVF